MAVGKRSAFTLVELLVVVTIIGVLVALVVRGVISARETARRTDCLNNQKELFTAMSVYKEKKGHYPGYVNPHPKGSFSWVIVLFGHMGRTDLWEQWSTIDFGTMQANAQSLGQLICPSDDPPEGNPLSYVVNCGLPDGHNKDGIHTGLFLNRLNTSTKVTESALKDGANTILLITENVQAGLYTDVTEANLGATWVQGPGNCQLFNRCIDDGSRPQDITYARPSSYHSGGCNVMYAGGNGDFVSDIIDYKTYQRMMAPDDNWCEQQGLF